MSYRRMRLAPAGLAALAHWRVHASAGCVERAPRRRRSRTPSPAPFASAPRSTSVNSPAATPSARARSQRQFNTITPENVLKWENVHPRPGVYDFAPADRYVDVRRRATACSSSATRWCGTARRPAGFSRTRAGKPLTRDTLLARMRDHIFTVVGRYKGRIKGWDVVNEALNEDGTLRQFAVVYDHRRRLYREGIPVRARSRSRARSSTTTTTRSRSRPKRNGAVALVKKLQAAGIPITAVGSQSHDKMDWPTRRRRYDSTIARSAALGVKVNITELDVDVLPPATRSQTRRRRDAWRRRRAAANPYAAGLPDSVQRALAERYADLFRVFASPSERHRPRYLLGRRRRRFVAQQLARPRTDELSVTVRSRRIARSRRSTL